MKTTVWYYVGLLVLLVILCLGIVSTRVDGFSDVQSYYTAGTDIQSQLQNGATSNIFTNSDLPLDPDGINAALNTPDLYNANPIPKDYSTHFVTDPAGMYTEADRNFCKGVTDPRNLPATNNEKIRCGWLYVNDPNTPSVGAIGNYKGPFFPKDSPKGSVWYWNLADAAKKEDTKYCKRLSVCSSLDAFNQFRSPRCGFCPSSSHGVPTDTAGNLLYPSDDVGGCDEVVTTSAKCPTVGGGGTTTVGSPGGSQKSVAICDQRDGNGGITVACTILQAKQAGMSDQGGFLKGAGGNWDAVATYAINDVLKSFQKPNMWGDPNVFLQYCMSIVQAQTTGATDLIRNAAAYLATSTRVELCTVDPAKTGPFTVPCMQQAFRTAGCQPGGSKYPKNTADAKSTALKTWGALNTEYTGLQLATQSTDPTVQRPALKQCLGVDMPLAPPLQCNTFVLQSHNFPDRYMVFSGSGRQIRIDQTPPVTASALTWVPSSIRGAIQLVPNAEKNLAFRHRGFELHADSYNKSDSLMTSDSSFYVRPGNADPKKVSFESVNFPGHFLRHSGFQIYLARKDGSDIFNKDSTFQPIKNGNVMGASLFTVPLTIQSYNFPDRYMVFPGPGNQVRIDKSPSPSFSALTLNVNSTDKSVQIVPVVASNMAFRHRGYELHADPYSSNDVQMTKDSFFNMRPGNADPSRVSFEAVNFPGYFLRHSGFQLYLNKKDGSDIFNKDSTFRIMS